MPVPKPMYHALPQHDAMWPSTLFPKETKFDSAGISAEAVFVLFRKGDADECVPVAEFLALSGEVLPPRTPP